MGAIAARWANPRPAPVPVLAPALPTPAPELSTWMALFSAFELEVADPGDAELRAPGEPGSLAELLEPEAVADLVAALAAAVVVAQVDGLAYLAGWRGTAAGRAPVFGFHPGDWGVFPAHPSLEAWLLHLDAAPSWADRWSPASSARQVAFGPAHPDQPDPRNPSPARPDPPGPVERPREPRPEDPSPDPSLPPSEPPGSDRTEPAPPRDQAIDRLSDPEPLARRADWLVRLLLGLPFEAALAAAPSLARFSEEQAELCRLPHLALYWLLAHDLLGNERALADALAKTAGLDDHPTVGPARAWVTPRPDRIDGLGAVERLGPLSRADYRARSRAVRSVAPPALVERAPSAAPFLPSDRAAQRFLARFEALGRPAPLGADPAAEEASLAALAEPRWLPVLDAALAAGAGRGDAEAGRGRIAARAALAEDLAELDRVIDAAGGTGSFGPARRDELWRAVARFDEPAAAARLAAGAARFAAQADDWIRTASKVPWDHLLETGTEGAQDLVVRFLEGVRIHDNSHPLVVEAARSARRFSFRPAVPGLRRVAAAGAGRLGDGSKTEILWAVAELDPEAGPFLGALFRVVQLEWEEAEDEDEGTRRGWALAAVTGPLLAVRPDRLDARATAAALFSRLAPSLAGPARPEAYEALGTLIEGVRQGRISELVPTLAALARVNKVSPGARRPQREAEVRAALDRALAELGRARR